MKHAYFKSLGFTLTELMAVVIIVAILSGIAGGTYRRAVERSRISDGEIAATTVAEAVKRHSIERAFDSMSGFSSISRPTIQQLDISFPNQQACVLASTQDKPYCVKTKHFEITILEGYVDARRVKKNTPGLFTIRAYLTDNQTRCHGTASAGKDLCISAGYTQCRVSSSSFKCVK